MRTIRILLTLLVLAALAVDYVVLTEGAFRFNTDESLVGIPTGVRVTAAVVATADAVTPTRSDETPSVVPRGAVRRPVSLARPDVQPARSRLILAADDGSPDAH